jgi:hypothetical protein
MSSYITGTVPYDTFYQKISIKNTQNVENCDTYDDDEKVKQCRLARL